MQPEKLGKLEEKKALNMFMKNEHDIIVQIAEFKARLSKYISNVRNGKSIALMEGDTPIARVVPYKVDHGRLVIRKPTLRAKELLLPPPLRKRVDSLSALLDERKR